MKKRVLLGMSGGTDSSVAAMLLQEQGFEVVGITFLFSEFDNENSTLYKTSKSLANTLGIEHHLFDLRDIFEKTIIEYFTEEYLAGNTPFPCALCNPEIKFKQLQVASKKLQCEAISTGHYVQIETVNNTKYVAKGIDPWKDQSFFLWGLGTDILNKLLFPLGKLTKEEVRVIAKNRGFRSVSERKDSLGLCFIEGSNYRKFLEYKGVKSVPGNFVDVKGNILGRHTGIINYTVGQRRGLGINLNKPLFVAEICSGSNEIVLADFEHLYKNKLILENCHFVNFQEVEKGKEYIVKVRYRLQETPCSLNIYEGGRGEVCLLKPEAMIANGQTAVFYDGNRVIGGGFIKSSK